MKEYISDHFRAIGHDPSFGPVSLSFSEEEARKAIRFHQSLPTYSETPLLSMQSAAERFGVDSIFVKDESSRFGLKAFKGLGGSYCMFRVLCEKFGLDEDRADYSTFLQDPIREACGDIHFATATDGNHGKGVSWAAKMFGCHAHVFMPKGSAEARRRAIEEAGSAEAVITDLNYDQTVRYAADLAERNGWILIQDTSWEGYERYPVWIMEGYLTMAAEAAKQMGDRIPTHVFLQAGVGSMAGAVEAYLARRYAGREPLVTIVEPTEAACVYQSVLAGDGKAHSITGDPRTIMAGLNCGTPCACVWPILRDQSAYFCACGDEITELGMRACAEPSGTDHAIVSGESGAVTYGLVLSILGSESAREFFKIGPDAVIFVISTEGDTDPEGYKKSQKKLLFNKKFRTFMVLWKKICYNISTKP